MSLYGGLGLGFDPAPKPVAAPAAEEKEKKEEKPKPTTNWSSSIKMMAPQLRRKQQAPRKTPAEIAAKLNQLRAQKNKPGGAVPKKVVKTIVTSTTKLVSSTPISTDAAEPFLPNTGPTEFKDEYHPKRPNDFDHWNTIFEREEVALRKEKEAKFEEESRRKPSKNTAAIAPPSSLVGEIATPAPAPKFSSTKPARPKPTDEIDSQNPFESDDDMEDSVDPFANMPVTGFGATATEGASTESSNVPKPAASLQISGEDAWAARAKLSKSNAVQHDRAPQLTNNVGAKMMEKFGWQDGKGLGKQEQGLNTALAVEQTGPRQGVIVQGATTVAAPVLTPVPAAPARPTTVEPSNKPSRVMLLMNLVGPGEVDSDLQSETTEECSKFGTVVKCQVHECPPNTTPPEEAVRIFVEFASADGAKKAVTVMHGRSFGGRIISAYFYDLSKYLRGVFS